MSSLDYQNHAQTYYKRLAGYPLYVSQATYEWALGKERKSDVKPVISYSTPVDVKEYPNKYVYIVDVPGLRDSGIEVQIEDTNVRADRKANEESGVVNYIQMQRKIKNVNCKFRLPFDANPHRVSACVYAGVLSITIKKFVCAETNKPQVVTVIPDFYGTKVSSIFNKWEVRVLF
ncbi:17.1 kDa class II heat shock protein-like [Papaver somniferum]|uniref:17.1 kDa class II heat shock protein-like n=1 Tax=Papaver somniferum TaxID=3469 RepID=UPI000E6FBF84|nr:17.1 kDa class II heat shock protein-like [Papaver somniferum]